MATRPAPKSTTLNEKRKWLTNEHPVHHAWNPVWKYLARARRGGRYMTDLLQRYDWELPADKKEDGNYAHRRRMATYINFPAMYLQSVWGFVLDKAPKPDAGIDYGTLGKVTGEPGAGGRVQQESGGTRNPTEAEIFHFNVDGIGNDGSELDGWLMSFGQAAGAFGHMWCLAEASASAPVTLEDKIRGKRTWLVPYEPPTVWDWHYEDGELQYAIIRTSRRRPSVDKKTGEMVNTLGVGYYLHVRRGWDGLWDGTEKYERGGWWQFDERFNLIERNGSPARGDYEMTDGRIPLGVLYAERDIGTTDVPAMSKSQIMELASLGESYMNLSSAADFEAWDSAKGIEYFVGITTKAFNVATDKMAQGSRYIPIIAAQQGQAGDRPTVVPGNTNAVPAEVFNQRLVAKRGEAVDQGAIQAEDSPDASGRAREASFKKRVAPKLALQASELQTFMNTIIPFVEQRNGHSNPSGTYTISRSFDLLGAALSVRDTFETLALTTATSATLISEGMAQLLKENGIITDQAVIETVKQEIKKSVALAQESTQSVIDRNRELNTPPAGGPSDPNNPDNAA